MELPEVKVRTRRTGISFVMDQLNRSHIPQDHGKVCGRCGLPVFHVVGNVWRHRKPKPTDQTCGMPPRVVSGTGA